MNLRETFGTAHFVESTNSDDDGNKAGSTSTPDQSVSATIHRITFGLSRVDGFEIVADIEAAEEECSSGVVEETKNGGEAEESNDGADNASNVSGERITATTDEHEESKEEAKNCTSKKETAERKEATLDFFTAQSAKTDVDIREGNISAVRARTGLPQVDGVRTGRSIVEPVIREESCNGLCESHQGKNTCCGKSKIDTSTVKIGWHIFRDVCVKEYNISL
jgi:hypothetical protein